MINHPRPERRQSAIFHLSRKNPQAPERVQAHPLCHELVIRRFNKIQNLELEKPTELFVSSFAEHLKSLLTRLVICCSVDFAFS